MTFSYRIVAAVAALQLGVRIVFAQAKDNPCFDSRFEKPNSNASYSVPGFASPGDNSSGDSTWTFSIAAVNHNGKPTQRLWINTSPAIQVDSSSLPYEGCMLALFELTKEAPMGHPNDGDCKSTLGEKCVTALLNKVKLLAQNDSRNADEDSRRWYKNTRLNLSFASARCFNYGFSPGIPDECNATLGGSFAATSYIGGRPRRYINETIMHENGYHGGPCPNLGKGTAATSPLLQFDTPQLLTPRDTGPTIKVTTSG